MCPLYGVARCPLCRSCLSIEVNGKTVGIFGSVCYTVDVCYEVCLFSEAPLYLPTYMDWKLYIYALIKELTLP